jgi:CO dehydrogenase/acetyl-CoA synthase delta subunit
MRIRYSRLVKIFGLVLLFLLVVPYLLKNLNETQTQPNMQNEAPRNEAINIEKNIDISDWPSAVYNSGILGNYEPKNLVPRLGLGEDGLGVQLDSSEESRARRTVAEFGFNMVASDKISLDRRIKDTRPNE